MSVLASWSLVGAILLAIAVYGFGYALGGMARRSRDHDERVSRAWIERNRRER